VRRQCVDLLAADGSDASRDQLRRLLVHGDPSEHVRQGLAEAFGKLGGYVELRILAGLDTPVEPSPRVRAAAVQAACRSTHAQVDTDAALTLLCDVLDREREPLPLAVACEDVDVLVAHAAANRCSLSRLMASLLALASHPEQRGTVHEQAAAAAERVGQSLVNARSRWRGFLAREIAAIEPGRSRVFSLARLAELPQLPVEPMFLGRILAELSRADFPLSASRAGDRLVIWRGDRFRRRLWRILHELRSRRPNKRQAFRHTIGRVMKGTLRAPPGGLDEVTATVVPGERVLVGEEGGWGRHLPTVDDVLDLPLWSGAPIYIFSSHGMTTMRSPPSRLARLKNRLAIAARYRELADLRLQSLRGREPHERARFASELRERYGVELEFARYDYPALHAPIAPPVTALFPALARGAT
jgi:hypothetical protein